jgi:hypothetical protein
VKTKETNTIEIDHNIGLIRLNETIKLEFNGFRYTINSICLSEVNIINDKEELAQMSGWGYKKDLVKLEFCYI